MAIKAQALPPSRAPAVVYNEAPRAKLPAERGRVADQRQLDLFDIAAANKRTAEDKT